MKTSQRRPNATIELFIENDLIVFSNTTTDVDIRGQIRLYLPKARQINSIHVTLQSLYSLLLQTQGWESGVHAEKSTNVFGATIGENHLPEGDHWFDFTLVLPKDWAPYERARWGRVYNKLVAVVETSSWFDKNMTAEEEVAIVYNYAQPGEANNVDTAIQGYDEYLGPYCLSFISPHLVVGGIFYCSLYLASPPQGFGVHSLDVSIAQSAVLISRVFKGEPEHPEPQNLRLARLDGLSDDKDREEAHLAPFQKKAVMQNNNKKKRIPRLTKVKRGQYFYTGFGGRLLDEGKLRPTTSGTVKTPIILSQELNVILRYDIPAEKDSATDQGTVYETDSDDGFHKERRSLRELVISKSLTIGSCCCRLETILLPSYCTQDPYPKGKWYLERCKSKKMGLSRGYRETHPCICDVSLSKQGYKEFQRQMESRIPPFMPRTTSDSESSSKRSVSSL